jgi:hypothetical protein
MGHENILQAKRLRDRADECRALAEIMKGQETREAYLKLAEAYEALASDEERLGAAPDEG